MSTTNLLPTSTPHPVSSLIAATGTTILLLAAAPSSVEGQLLVEAFITHRGHEQIIAGPNVPSNLGLTTDPGYAAAEVALNAAGTRVWFVLFNWGADPEYQVWTMLSDGTGRQQIVLTADNCVASATGLTNLFVNTNDNGNIAVLDSTEKFSRINLSDPAPPARHRAQP